MPAAPDLMAWISFDHWRRSLRYAARGLCRSPAFSAAVFCSLVLCIGPNAAILSALYALVIKPLPFPQAEQLGVITNIADRSGAQVVQSSMPQYADFKARADLFSGFAAIRRTFAILNDETAPDRIAKDLVTPDFFPLVGVNALLGRFFTAEEGTPGRDRVLVMTQNFWESHYNADPTVIGRQVRLDGEVYTVVGVAPRALSFLHQPTCFFQPYAPPLSRFDPQLRYRGDVILYARLKAGSSFAVGLAQLKSIEADFQSNQAPAQIKAYLATAGFRLSLEPLRAGGAVNAWTRSLWLLQGSAFLVLLIGCVNVMNLFLARMNARRSELSIRVALGAGRALLYQPIVAESLLLTGAAAVSGLSLAFLVLRVFNLYLPTIAPAAPPLSFDPAVALILLGVSGGVALVVGILPLHLLWRMGLRLSGSRTSSSSRSARSVSSGLVSAQVALAVVLLFGASLLIRSFSKALAVNPGFDAKQVVQARLNLPKPYAPVAALEQRYRDPHAEANLALQHRILESFASIPGVESVAESLDPVLDPEIRPVPFGVRGANAEAGENQPLIHIAAVSPRFFTTVGMRLLSGRDFTSEDDFSKAPVAIVDETFVRRYFSNRMIEGQEIYLNKGLPLAVDSWARIVGVVNRPNFTGLDSRDNLPMVFVPMVGFPTNGFGVVIRSHRPAGDLVREMRTKLWEIDPTLPLYSADSLQAGLDHLLVARRGITLLLSCFSAAALLLSAVGLYGVLAYDVSQRTREIGIRGAIGASRRQIVAMILRQGLGKTVSGLLVGLIGAVIVIRYFKSFLFGVVASDAISYLCALGLLAFVSLLASWLPALQAARVDPIIALRAE